jgi:hypothetical protein
LPEFLIILLRITAKDSACFGIFKQSSNFSASMAGMISIPLFRRSFNAIVKTGQIVFVPDIAGAAIAARFRFWGTAFTPSAE